MNNFFLSNVKPTESQLSVLKTDDPDLIIEGAAGTGKTLLTILLAEKILKDNPTYDISIIILTRSLKRFIVEALRERGLYNVTVFYEYEFPYTKKDFIIIDEAQDFNINQIKKLIECAVYGVYILGDSNQRILNINNGNQTATMEGLRKELNFKHKILYENVRFNQGITNIINEAFPNIEIKNPIGSSSIKPRIYPCGSKENEVKKIIEILKNAGLEGSSGILVQKNEDILYILDMLQNKGIPNLGFKHKSDEQLNFNQNSINLLTYHSAKGLEFNNVILPFLDFSLDIPNLFYVAFSRARNVLFLLYSENFPLELKIKKPINFEGEIKRPQIINGIEEDIKFNGELMDIYNEFYKENNIEILDKIKEHENAIKNDIIFLKDLGVSEKTIIDFLKINNIKVSETKT